MKIAYFDTIAGISGDMVLGAFLNAGIPIEVLNSEIAKLGISGVRIEIQMLQRSMITAIKVNVVETPQHRDEQKRQSHHERSFEEIRRLIESSGLNDRVKGKAVEIFHTLARAEARIHDTSVENIHFHEVGAIDSIVDIIGAAVCMEYFGIEAVYSSPVRLGSGGTVSTRHGEMPVPVPAAVEILKGYPTVLTNIPYELTTPTGAAIIKTLSRGVLNNETYISLAVGYGAGSREIPQVPNLLRVVIGEMKSSYDEDEIAIVETNIDDMNPEIYPYLIEQLLSCGAHDAYLVPIIMKKGRPGILLSVMVHTAKLDEIIRVIYNETSTIGLRIQRINRIKLQRQQIEMNTSLGKVTVKAITHNGKEQLIPEFEECKRLAIEHKIPLIEVYKIVEGELKVRR
ncbi:MAG: nickel pincer cofactor biosynthesis protein LarC [Bacteroidota bacterium]